MQDLATKVRAHAGTLQQIRRSLNNIDERLKYLEARMDDQINHTKNGNGTRNIIAIMVAAKIIFEGFGAIDWTGVEHIIRLLG